MVKAIPRLDVSLLIQRISGLVVTPEPNAVVLDFTTNLPTSPIVEIFSLVKGPSGELVFDGGGAEVLAVGFNFLPTPGSTQHHARLTRLQQRRQCMYRITAGGGVLGGLAVVTGEFTTGRRDATVTVREILMFTDGDSGLGGSGELSFDYGVYDEDDNRVAQREYSTSISAGDLRNLPFGKAPAMSWPFAQDWLSMYVLGTEYDQDVFEFGEDHDAPSTLPSQTKAYENDDEVAADAMQSFALPRTTGEHRVGFQLDTGPRGIFFITTGWITVVVNNPPPTRYLRLGKVKSAPAAVMATRGSAAVAGLPDGKKTLFALSPAGQVAVNTAVRRWRAPDWKVVSTGTADAAVVALLDEAEAAIFTVTGESLRVHRVRLDGDGTEAEAVPLAEGVQPVLSLSDSQSGIAVVAVLGSGGEAWLLLAGAGEQPTPATDLGGSFSGPLAVAWIDDSSFEVAGVTTSGTVETARLDVATVRRSERVDAEWTAIDGEGIVAVCTITEDEQPLLVALSADRRVLTRTRTSAGWSDQWVDAGSFDEQVPLDYPEDEAPLPPDEQVRPEDLEG